MTRHTDGSLAVKVRLGDVIVALLLAIALSAGNARASTYVVYIPLDSPIYQELGTLNGLGYLDTYLDEIKPISRIEAARLTLEAQSNFREESRPDPLARQLIDALKVQLHREVGWLVSHNENNPPTLFRPVARVEAQYIFSSGERRRWQTVGERASTPAGSQDGIDATEGTPLLPNNDGLPTESGSNETFRVSGWTGLWGFITGYGEFAVAGPVTHDIPGVSRVRPLGAEAVVSLGNIAISFGQEEMWWGTGHFSALSQGDNAQPFPAVRVQNIHPTHLPWFLRYLGPFRFQIFFGQLDGDRYFSHPWIDGEIFAFKPLPNFEFGLTHAITFGGSHNDYYSFAGFLGRATAFSTGNPSSGNTNSRGGIFLKFRFPHYRDLIVYQEILGEDNLTKELPPVGRFMPFLAVSYQGGFYLPRLTLDGRTYMRFEYAILEPNYSIHNDTLYWTNDGAMMANPLGPNATEVDLEIGRWLYGLNRVDADIFYTEQAPSYGSNAPYPSAFYPYPLTKEHSVGMSLGFMSVPSSIQTTLGQGLASLNARVSAEYVSHINYAPADHSIRVTVLLSVAFRPGFGTFIWK